jgi:predicted GIY-YIG superfamily endonuclease
MNTNKSNRFCHLYRHFDKDGNLLYIGISVSVLHRISQHKRNSKWFAEICNITIQRFTLRRLAEEAEKLAIENEKPLHNKIYKNPARDKIRNQHWAMNHGEEKFYVEQLKRVAEQRASSVCLS